MNIIPLLTPSGEEMKVSLLDMELAELTEYMKSLGQPAYRARQIWEWIYQRYASDFAQMSNLPAALRAQLAEQATLHVMTPVVEQVSLAKDTLKILFQLHDGQTIEAVLMLYDKRRTLWIVLWLNLAIAVGFFAAKSGLLTREAFRGAIADSVPAAARELNLRAFEAGYEYGIHAEPLGESLEAETAVAEE